MAIFFDSLGRKVTLPSIPQRIISTVPSQTELLHSLELDDKVIGITKFCTYPHLWYKTKDRIGGTKNLNIQKIKKLLPDLIIANKEENNEEQILELVKDFPIWVSDVATYEDALKMIHIVGVMTGKEEKATQLVQEIEVEFKILNAYPPKILKSVYLIWKDPYMAVGGGTFINDMLCKSGFSNVFKNYSRYPQIEIDELVQISPDILMLSSEPYPFQEKHLLELQPLLPHTKIVLVNGELFSWYGSRMVYAPAYFASLRQQIVG